MDILLKNLGSQPYPDQEGIQEMKKLRKSFKLAAAVFLVVALIIPSGAWAASVFINNPSFENYLTGWTLSGLGGTWAPASYVYPSGIPDGVRVAWLHAGSLSQTLTGNTVQAGHQYDLGVWIAQYGGSPTYTVQLVSTDGINDHVLATVSGTAQYRVFNQVTLSFAATNQYLGETLKIKLANSGNENDFDMVTLSDTLVPTPSTLLLLGSGVTALIFIRRRRKS